MTTTITHTAQGITYEWTLNLSGLTHGTFWDGSPYVVAQSGMKVMNVHITSIIGGVSVTENPFRKEYHALATNTNGSIFYGHLYLNGMAKNPLGIIDTSPSANSRERFNRCIFDSRTFDAFDRGWRQRTKSTDIQSSYNHFALDDFMANKALIENGTGFTAAANDVFLVAKSNYDPNDPNTYTTSRSGGYPYQKHRNRSNVLGYGTLFVLAEHPEETCFRPPVFWPEEDLANRPLHALSEITGRVPSGAEIKPTISGSSSNRPPSYADNNFVEFCYGFPIGNGNTYSQFMPLYPAHGANTPGDSYGAYYQIGLFDRLRAIYSDASNTSLSEQNRLKILRSVVQWGIDAFGGIKSFASLGSGAGQRPCTSRPWSIIAGWFLNNDDMRAPETTMLYGSYANRTTRVITSRANAYLNSPDLNDAETRTMKGYRSASVGGTDGYVVNRGEWERQVFGNKNTDAGKKRRLARRTSMESICYFKVSGDIDQSRMLYYKNLGKVHNRVFGHGVTDSPQVTAGTLDITTPVRFLQTKTNTFAGTMAYLRWSQNPFPRGWTFTHAGKSPTIDFSYIRVTEDPDSNTSTTQQYRILKCAGDFRSNLPTNGYYTLYLDREWVGGIPSPRAKYEMVPFTENDVGDIFYVIAYVAFDGSDSALVDANPNPYTIYGGICYPPMLSVYSWIKYAKRELNGGNPVDLDEDSTHAHEFLEQITRKMAYSFYDYNLPWMAGLHGAWEKTALGKWLNLKNPIEDGWEGVAFDKGQNGWEQGAPHVEVWNGVSIIDLNFGDEEDLPLPIDPDLLIDDPIVNEGESDDADAGGEEEPTPNIKNNLLDPLGVAKKSNPFGVRGVYFDTDRKAGIANRQPINTNPAFTTNFRLMIPKVRGGVFFCTEVSFPQTTMEPLKIPVPLSPSLKFFGDKLQHGEMTVKFIINEDFSNWFELTDWFRKTQNYYGFFQDGSQARMLNEIADSGQLLILNNKKNPVARIHFDGLMITALGNMPMNSAVADNSILSCDATFQFTGFDIKDP
jgi:hypothetical protein